MRGFWANERVDGDIWNIKTPVYRWIFNYFKSLEIKFLSTADYIISLTHSGKEVIKHWNIPDVSQSNIEVIPCCADFNHFCKSENQSKKTQQYKKELGIVDDNFVLSYLGSLGTWYMLDEMLDFFKVLLEQRSNALFLFITADNPDFIYNSAMNKNIDKSKIIIASSNREDVPAYIDISDMSIFFIKPFFSKKASSPTKMAEIMGMGIPIICNNNVGDVESIMQESNSGIIIKEFSNEAYNKAILEIDNVLKKDKDEIREYSIKTFSLEEGVAKYLKIYNNLNECSK
jgi:glycosyltransferase involved in cell wall biosynthesis